MQIDPNSEIVKICVEGMNIEGDGEGESKRAITLFQKAWNLAKNKNEKFIAAHYVARNQKNVSDKLKWDERALNLALEIDNEDIKGSYPSLYLNIGKCYEDLYPKRLNLTGICCGKWPLSSLESLRRNPSYACPHPKKVFFGSSSIVRGYDRFRQKNFNLLREIYPDRTLDPARWNELWV